MVDDESYPGDEMNDDFERGEEAMNLFALVVKMRCVRVRVFSFEIADVSIATQRFCERHTHSETSFSCSSPLFASSLSIIVLL